MRSSTASVTWTPQNGIPMHPIFNSVNPWLCKAALDCMVKNLKAKIHEHVHKVKHDEKECVKNMFVCAESNGMFKEVNGVPAP